MSEVAECGIYEVVYTSEDGDCNYTSLTARFGDGCMRVTTELWPDQVGIGILYDKEHAEPWAKEDYINTDLTPPKPSVESKSIKLVFDKVESIDAVINQLSQVRNALVGIGELNK